MEIKRPLAYRARPKIIDDVVGQTHIVGKNGVIRRMINNDQMFSLILYGPPGVGKTTIATIIGENFGINTFIFNASTDKKAQLREIIQVSINYGALVIIDEIHRMNKDIQDFLLPHVENGNIIMIGLTTVSLPWYYGKIKDEISRLFYLLSKKNSSSNSFSSTTHIINASFAVGLNCPFSIDPIVCLETPTNLARLS